MSNLVDHARQPNGAQPEQPPALSLVDQLRADNADLRAIVERARWALGTDQPQDTTHARLQADRGRLHVALGEVLDQFRTETHPGQKRVQSGHVDAATLNHWRDILNGEQP
ncbi:hypothetical protein [Streptomyces sp. H27-D2]|uniref:hypothetical protein n=1 Tax=Streptomyces sp. H27-D2 TaxID=3046304 RepID=UPI002DB8A840|nr:hypothetical protein [Streptomyces sp. H27-D2]MEC4016118.1 hypothetical protein [Streptomyces sp. H27-D2]